MNFKQSLSKVTRTVAKHSPVIFTTVGVAGLGATAVLAYKSRDKVQAVVEDIEAKREAGEEVNKFEVVKDLVEATYLPITVGALSVGSIIMSHRVQRKRILTLSGVLAAEQARNIYFEKKYKKVHGEEAYMQFVTPTDEVEHVEVGKNGKEKITVHQVKKDIDHTVGQWYDESYEYASDDHSYNVAFIEAVNDRMQTLLFQRGSLLLNEVREALGFDRLRNGALMGWTTQDNFDIEFNVMNMLDEGTGEMKDQIWVTWSRPRYIYQEVELGGGRYSPFEV
jgi:Family of unknown function (DUF6353)